MAEQPIFDVEAFKKFEREGYSRVAEDYDRATAPTTAQVNDAVLDAAGVARGARVLDVACGPGWLSAAAVIRGAIVTGVDIAEPMLTIARVRCPEADFRAADAEDLPFADGQFEAVICNLSILHFASPERAIAEAFRVLARGGRYAFTCWTPPARNPFMRLILVSVQTHGTMEVNLPPGPSPFRFGDPEECERAMSAAGFQAVSVTEVPVVHTPRTAEAIVPSLLASTARMGPLLAAQTAEQRANIEAAIAAGAKAYDKDGSIAIPGAVMLCAARKP